MGHRRGSAFMLFLLIFYVLFVLVFSIAVIPVLRTHFNFAPNSPWFIIFHQLMILILPLGIWLAFNKEKLTAYLPNMKLGNTNIILILFLSIFLQPAMMLISGISGLFFPNQVGEMVTGMMAQPFWLLILAIAITPAICEEIVFRGYVQSVYRNVTFRTAAILNGLFFAFIHFNLQQFLYAFAMGVIFAYMVHYTRSIRAGILSHFIMNASQISLAWLARHALQWADELGIYIDPAPIPQQEALISIEQLSAVMGIGVIALLATPCAIILFKVFLSHNRQRNIEYDMKKEIIDDPIEPIAATPGEDKIETETPEELPSPKPFRLADPFFIAVIALYVFLILFLF